MNRMCIATLAGALALMVVWGKKDGLNQVGGVSSLKR